MPGPRPVLVVLAVLALTVAGCGNTRLKLGGKSPDAVLRPLGKPAVLDKRGLTLSPPGGWTASTGASPLVIQYQSSQSVVAVWRYKRVEPLPSTPGQLDRARRALIKAAQARDKTLKVISSGRTKINGNPAVMLVADAEVLDAKRRIRSLHIFGDGSEIVIDALAPAAAFPAVDKAVFEPLDRTVKLKAPGKA